MKSSVIHRLILGSMALAACVGTTVAAPKETSSTKHRSATTAVSVLAANPTVRTSLAEILQNKDFIRARKSVSIVCDPELQELILTLFPLGPTEVGMQEAKRWSENMFMGGLTAVCSYLAGMGWYELITNVEHDHNIPKHTSRECTSLLLGTALSTAAVILLVNHVRTSYNHTTALHACMHDVSLYAAQAQHLAQIVASCSELQAVLPSAIALAGPLTPDTDDGQKLAELLQSTTLQDAPTLFSIRGRVHAAYALMHQARETFAASLQAVTELQAAVVAAQALIPFTQTGC